MTSNCGGGHDQLGAPRGEAAQEQDRHAGKAMAVPFCSAPLLLGALVVYPIVYSVYPAVLQTGRFRRRRQLPTIFTADAIRTRDREHRHLGGRGTNLATVIGLDLRGPVRTGPLAPRVQARVFMPMAISFLAAVVIFPLGVRARNQPRRRSTVPFRRRTNISPLPWLSRGTAVRRDRMQGGGTARVHH